MKILAADVKELRDLTNAGMMDCKKALLESHGDFAKAKLLFIFELIVAWYLNSS